MSNDSLLEGFLRHVRVERGLSENGCLSYKYQLGVYVTFLEARG